jgi:hypothetical protein
MSRARKPVHQVPDYEDLQRQQVCGYIFDLLGSLEAIAAENKLSVLAKLIQSARSEAAEYR